MDLHSGFSALLELAHVAHHAFNVFEHVAAAHVQQFALAGQGGCEWFGPGFERLDPVLHGGALVFTHLVQVMQAAPRVQQRPPVVETRVRVDEFALPMVQLVGQFTAQLQKAVHHLVDHAQHQVGRAGGQARAGGGCLDPGGAQQFGGISVTHRTIGRVHRQQHLVKHGKTDRAGVNAFENRRPAAMGQLAQTRTGIAGLGGADLARARCQTPEHQQVILRGEIVVRWQEGIEQVGDVQIDQLKATQAG